MGIMAKQRKRVADKIRNLRDELSYWKKNSVMICGMSSQDDDGTRAEELGVKEDETFFDFDEEGFVEDLTRLWAEGPANFIIFWTRFAKGFSRAT